MRRAPRLVFLLLFLVALSARVPAPASAAQLWTGVSLVFSKAAGADPDLEANQDRMTPAVWITRGGVGGLFNAVSESQYVTGSPAGTEWAAGDIADYATLTYENWVAAVGACPPCQVGVPFVVHLIAEDIYIPITVTDWGQGILEGGRFTYTRGTPEAIATRPVSWGSLKAAPARVFGPQ